MTNVMAEAVVVAALPAGGDALQRLRALVAKLGIQGWPSREHRRVVLALARRLGVVSPEPSGRERSPALDIPPAAESVIRRREQEWRELTRERLERAVSAVQRSPLGVRVALQAKDLSAGARAIQILGALGVNPTEVDPEALAWAGRLAPEDRQYVLGKDAALLPDEAVIAGGFQALRRRAAVILKSRVKRAALESGAATPLHAPVLGAEVDAAVADELLADYSATVARRAAVKRAMLALWRQQAPGAFPEAPPADRWERLAWLAFVGHALPPVLPARRFEARGILREELAETGLTVNQLAASLEVARRTVNQELARTPARASA